MRESKYTDEDKAKAKEVYERAGVREAARAVGCAPSTVDNWAHDGGWKTGLGKTTEAARAKLADDFDAKRLQLSNDLLEDIQRVRARLFAPIEVYNFGGKNNTFSTAQLEEPSPADKKALMTVIAIGVDKLLALDSHGKPTKVEVTGNFHNPREEARELLARHREESERKERQGKGKIIQHPTATARNESA